MKNKKNERETFIMKTTYNPMEDTIALFWNDAEVAAKIAADADVTVAAPSARGRRKTAYEKKKETMKVGARRAKSSTLNPLYREGLTPVTRGKMRNHWIVRDYANTHSTRNARQTDSMDDQERDFFTPRMCEEMEIA